MMSCKPVSQTFVCLQIPGDLAKMQILGGHFWKGGGRTSKNRLFHKSNENTGKNDQNQLFQKFGN